MIAFLRSTDGNPDSRLQKYMDAVEGKRIPYLSLCWDRNLKYEDDDRHLFYHKTAVYGSGIKNLMKLAGFNCYLIKQLVKNRKRYTTIHACDFDTIVPALFMKVFFRKRVIYDIFDWFVDSRELHNPVLRNLILGVEHIALRLSDRTIVCEEERKKQICYLPKHIWVLPNIPNFTVQGSSSLLKADNILKVSYVGVLTRHRGLEKVLQFAVAHADKIELDIAGFGELETNVKEACRQAGNVHFHGTVSYKDGIDIMRKSDLILAIYEKTISNHIYAAPNKYYEGLFLGKPIVTTKDTYVGIKTEKYKTGFAIGESMEDLNAFFLQEDLQNKIAVCAENAARMWKDKYSTYINDFMNTVYIPYIVSKRK